MKVLFWLYKSRPNKKGEVPIYARITINSLREQFSINLFVNPRNWNKDKQRLKGRNELSSSVNQLIDKVEADLLSIYNEMSKVFNNVTAKDIRNNYFNEDNSSKGLIEVFEIHNQRIKSLIGKEYSEETFFIYERTKRNILEFLKRKLGHHDIRLDRLKRSFIEDYIYFLKTIKDYHTNTIYKNVQRVNRILNFAEQQDWLSKNPFRNTKLKKEKKEITYLSKDELKQLESKTFTIPRIAVVRDLFVFQIYTGLAYRELKNLTHSNIQIGVDSEKWIVAERQKTGRTFKVPLLPKALDILNRYKEHTLDPNRELLPVPSNQKFNAYLKEVGDLCGILQPLTTHLARRTFACTITLLNGVPLSTVSSLLGHSNIGITQEAYAKVVDDKLSKDMEVLRKKLSS